VGLKQLGVTVTDSLFFQRGQFTLEDDMAKGTVQFASCYFASGRRSLGARFLTTPIRMSLGAVCCRSGNEKLLESIGRAIANLPLKGAPVRLLAIVVQGEVGHAYATDTLQLRQLESRDAKSVANAADGSESFYYAIDKFDLADLVKLLRDFQAAIQNQTIVEPETPLVPVILIDEYSSLQLVIPDDRHDLQLVLPLTTFRKVRETDVRRELPVYRVSFACSRKYPEFVSYIDDSFAEFLATEVQTTASALARLCWDLETAVFDATKRIPYWAGDHVIPNRELSDLERRIAARQYALCATGLNEGTVEESRHDQGGWGKIQRRAFELIHQTIASDGPEDGPRLSDHIKATLLHADPRVLQTQQFETLDQAASISEFINKRVRLSKLRGLDTGQAERYLESLLRGEEGEWAERIAVRVYEVSDVLDSPKLRENVCRLLNELAALYRRQQNPVGLPPRAKFALAWHDAERIGFQSGKDEMRWIHRYGAPFVAEHPEAAAGPIIADRIQQDIRESFRRYDRIALAESGERGDGPPAGVICILEKPGCFPEDSPRANGRILIRDKDGNEQEYMSEDEPHLSRSIEFRYIFVNDSFRGQQVGRLLMGEALRWCAKQAYCDRVRATVLPQLHPMISRLEKHDFTLVEPLKYDWLRAPFRLVYEHSIQRNR